MPHQPHHFAILAGRTRRLLVDVESIGLRLHELNRFGLASQLLDVELQLADLYLELSELSGQTPRSAAPEKFTYRGQQRLPF